MKICLVNSYYPPYIGGAETYVASLAKGLTKRGHKVTVYCADRPLKPGHEFSEGVEIVRMRTPATFYGTPLVLFSPKIFSKYDVIHANFPSPYLAGVSAWIARVSQTPAVLTWHNDLPPVTSAAGFLVKMHDFVSWGYLGAYGKIIATTPIYLPKSKILRRYGNKVTVVPNGVDTLRFNPTVDGKPVREKFGLSNKVCLFVGALTTWHAYKGLDILINAFKMVKDKEAQLLIVGGGNMLPHYRSLVGELGLETRVTFAGRVNDETLPSYYAACDVTVLPSKDSSEGFGLALLEAMATGKAVIGSRVGGIPWLVKDRENGLLVEPNDTTDLARAIDSIFSDDRGIGKAGRIFAKANSWDNVAGKVESIYKSLL